MWRSERGGSAKNPQVKEGTFLIVLIAFQFIISIAVIIIVLAQPSKGEGFGSIGGGGQLFHNKARGWEAILEKLTTYAAVLFMVSSVLLILLNK